MSYPFHLTGISVGQRVEHIKCPLCGHNMMIRQNRANKQEFFGCSKFPNCKGTRQYNIVNNYYSALTLRNSKCGSDLEYLRREYSITKDSQVGVSRRVKAASKNSRTAIDSYDLHTDDGVVSLSELTKDIPTNTASVIFDTVNAGFVDGADVDPDEDPYVVAEQQAARDQKSSEGEIQKVIDDDQDGPDKIALVKESVKEADRNPPSSDFPKEIPSLFSNHDDELTL